MPTMMGALQPMGPLPLPNKSLRRLRVVAEDVAGGSCVVMVATGEEYGHRRRVEQLLAIVNDDLGWNMSNDAPGEEEKVNGSRLTLRELTAHVLLSVWAAT